MTDKVFIPVARNLDKTVTSFTNLFEIVVCSSNVKHKKRWYKFEILRRILC